MVNLSVDCLNSLYSKNKLTKDQYKAKLKISIKDETLGIKSLEKVPGEFHQFLYGILVKKLDSYKTALVLNTENKERYISVDSYIPYHHDVEVTGSFTELVEDNNQLNVNMSERSCLIFNLTKKFN